MMNSFQNQQPPPFTPIGPPAQPPAVQAAGQVIQSGNQLYQQLIRQYLNAYNQVWNNPSASPAAIIAAMGTQAVKVFTLSSSLAQFLVNAGAVDTDGVPVIPVTIPPGWGVTFNNDGSATCTGTLS